MILLFRRLIVLSVISVLALSSLAHNVSSVDCDHFCGKTHVSYPFGFSDGCKIKLDCSSDSGTIKIQDFLVENVTSDQILIRVPPKCNRGIGELSGLFGANFAPTWRNGVLLENCSARVNDCVIPSRLVRSRIGFDCDSGEGTDYYNVSCYSVGLDDVSEFLDFGKVTAKGNCSILFSSIMVDFNDSGNSLSGSSPITLDFQTAELGWWVDGDCDCDPNASCTRVTHGEEMGYRCKCKKGYTGDGFAGGKRCRKVSDCSAGGFMSGRCHGSTLGILIGGIIAGVLLVAALAVICEINLAALAIDRIGKGRIDEIIDPFLEPNRDAWTLSSVHKVAELAFRCLAYHRDMRPSMMEVADELEQIRLSGWAPLDETIHMGSSVASSCSSPYQGSEKSLNTSTTRKASAGSRRLIVSQRAVTGVTITEEKKDSSPVSVQDAWLSEQSSPSTNSLLGNVAR
ncbi:Wall-associated receptor kinase-like 14 [Sesamum alatum]|uniref:Wall-associated receptor kinase-like 14 n=1 Tax=Sesamum alatum TaxID=300844 RepID=A0AAE1Y9V5_9LAMI|nr:Wall-associated receptor kinase-like 14 [Sesamum alatum]